MLCSHDSPAIPAACPLKRSLPLQLGSATNFPTPPALHIAENPAEAVSLANSLAQNTGYVLATGSIFLAAEVRGLQLTDRPPGIHVPSPVTPAL